MVRSVADWVGKTDLSTLGDRSLRVVNELLDRVPFLQSTNITAEQAAALGGHVRPARR